MNQPNYAGFGSRFVALLIDGVILCIPNLFLGFFGILVGWLYFALMESSSKQATVGKMVMKIRVTDLNGNRLTFGKATGRYFSKLVSSLILCIGYLMAAWTDKKQALHDIMAGTLVLGGAAQEASVGSNRRQHDNNYDNDFSVDTDTTDHGSHDTHHHDSGSFDNGSFDWSDNSNGFD